MENYLVTIKTDPGGANETENYYAITGWDATEMILDGPFATWTVGGTTVDIKINHFEKEPDVTIPASPIYPSQPEHTFPFVDRRGNDVRDQR